MQKKSKSYWKQHVSSWQNSGLTQAEYCRQQNIKNVKSFNWHKRKILGVWKPDLNSSEQSTLNLVALPNAITQYDNDTISSSNNSGISISFGSKATINIEKSFNKNCLAEVVKVMSQL